jgi:hypothetical protein
MKWEELKPKTKVKVTEFDGSNINGVVASRGRIGNGINDTFFVTINFEDNDKKKYENMCDDYCSYDGEFSRIQPR